MRVLVPPLAVTPDVLKVTGPVSMVPFDLNTTNVFIPTVFTDKSFNLLPLIEIR